MADPNNLCERARALRLTQKEIAERAKLDPNTVTRLFDPERGNVLLSTVVKVEAVIVAEETAQRVRLNEAAQ